ncbi:MAG: molybdopterin-dependent oxidoreductase [Cyanobacteriota bacterium]|nr:molybdopterin-dependent oxidoreductase [Cyanobacteriota bacterium]
MRRRHLLQWGAFGGSLWLGGSVMSQQLSGTEILEGAFPLLDLRDFSQPLPAHWLTETSAFYVQSAFGTPEVDLDTWRLTIDGLVKQSLSFTLAEIQAEPAEDFYWTLQCIGNPAGGELIGNALWRGCRLLPLLERVGIPSTTPAFALHGADGYVTALPTASLLHPDVRLAYRMNGDPLPAQHGAPLRVFIPGKYGQKQPKWLTQITGIPSWQKGHWERLGWSNEANILTQALPRQLQSMADPPPSPALSKGQRVSQKVSRLTLPTGRIVLAGVALASGQAISQVLVSADGGTTWQIANQNQPDTPYEWTLWRYAWSLPEVGNYELMARAVTPDGAQQPLNDIIPFDGTNAVLRIRLKLVDSP